MIDLVKKYQTRAGRKARVYATDGDGPYPVHGAEWNGEGWAPGKWNQDGEYYSGAASKHDLIEVREKLTVSGWVNIYRVNGVLNVGVAHETDDEAAESARVGVHRPVARRQFTIEFEEGDGL